ncbi:IMPACT family protein [Haploplasma axanthum]|uniref:Proline dipeptidase pepQ n=1 Tax=Haploplasma axanthum TaxID=29552 RepID=A0A449BD61_HAPAX|nr:YigZ family protein [Haploplasma axanthum]VEU80401.1 proline dipeptidase pepQ [Haploplasma axanthum]
MKYLKEQTEEKIVIQKSEFIGILYPIKNDEDINNSINDAKKRYPKATHYVTAWIRGAKAEYASSNDDGEPARTAGYPALDVLMHHEVTDILIVIIRYFGGIKLGAGGLTRAYRSSCVEVLKKAKFYNKVFASKYEIIFSYNLIDTIEHLLSDNVTYVKKDYLDKVKYEIVFLNNDLSLLDNIKHQIEVKELPKEELYIDL